MNISHAKRGADGLAIIGKTPFALRGIRMVEGEEGDENPNDPEPIVPEGELPVTPDTVAPDLGAYEAKVSELSADLAARDQIINDLTAQLAAAKAHNYDLLMAVPSVEAEPDILTPTETVDEFDDFFDTSKED